MLYSCQNLECDAKCHLWIPENLLTSIIILSQFIHFLYLLVPELRVTLVFWSLS